MQGRKYKTKRARRRAKLASYARYKKSPKGRATHAAWYIRAGKKYMSDYGRVHHANKMKNSVIGYQDPPKDGRCEKCRRKPRVLHMDHDHKTKRFRGWLCFGCNSGIGKLGDSIAGLQQALGYLRRASYCPIASEK